MALTAAEKAQKAFKQEEQRREGAKNLAEYRQAQVAEQNKIERLRAMRLAHEAETAAIDSAASDLDADAAPAKKTPAKKQPRRKATRRTH